MNYVKEIWCPVLSQSVEYTQSLIHNPQGIPLNRGKISCDGSASCQAYNTVNCPLRQGEPPEL